MFGLTSDPKAIAAAGVTPPSIVIYRKFDDPKFEYPSATVASASVEDIEEFLKANSMPLVDEVGADNYQTYATSGLPLGYLFLDPAEGNVEEHLAYLRPIAKKYKGKVNFVWIDAVKFGDHAKALNLLEAKWPAFVIQDLSEQLKYPMDQSEAVTQERVATWVDQYTGGDLKPQLKSQPVPATQDENVFTLVSTEFDPVVFDDDKDVLVEFYAPWCVQCLGMCRGGCSPGPASGVVTASDSSRLGTPSVIDTLKSRFVYPVMLTMRPLTTSLLARTASQCAIDNNVPPLVLISYCFYSAKMDATENDIPPSAPFRVSGFPTIKFKAAGSRDFIDYDGDRSLESLIEFVEQHAKNPLDPKQEFKGKTASTKVAVTEAAEQTEHEHDEL